LLGAAGPLVSAAAPIAHDLGEGLTYLRATTLPADLPAGNNLRACVLDLRYATGDTAAAVALAGWLKFHGSVRTPVFILANAATAAPLLDVLIPGALPAGTLTLGVPGPGFVPDLAVNTPADEELSAFAVLAQGTPPAGLLRENSDKVRYDEAAMVRDLAQGERPSATEPTPLVTQAAAPPPSPPIDRTLQRAVHVHRGLAALRLLRG
jgi:hypothetical protein